MKKVEMNASLKLRFQLDKTENWNFQIAETDVDCFAGVFENPWIKAAMFSLYLFGILGCFGLKFIVWFERSGQAGHYRTLVNQLNSFNLDHMIIYFVMPITTDMIRMLWGPLPSWICDIGVLGKNMFLASVSQTVFSMTLTKFTFVFVYKSIPSIEDNFFSIFIFSLVYMVSLLVSASRFCLPGRPILNKLICTGHYYKEWNEESDTIQTASIIVIMSSLCHLLLSIPIAISKRRLKMASNHQNMINFGGMMTSWIGMSLLVIAIFLLSTLNATNPEDLNEFPNNLLVHGLYFVIPIMAIFTLNLMFFARSQSLRKEAWNCLLQNSEKLRQNLREELRKC